MGVPSKCYYMKSWDSDKEWSSTFGTLITVHTTQWVSQGSYIHLFVIDKNRNIFHQACKKHSQRTGQNYAFVFRDRHVKDRIYQPSVSMIYTV